MQGDSLLVSAELIDAKRTGFFGSPYTHRLRTQCRCSRRFEEYLREMRRNYQNRRKAADRRHTESARRLQEYLKDSLAQQGENEEGFRKAIEFVIARSRTIRVTRWIKRVWPNPTRCSRTYRCRTQEGFPKPRRRQIEDLALDQQRPSVRRPPNTCLLQMGL